MNEISTSFDSAKLNINSTLAKFSEIYSPSDVKNLSDKNKYHDNISLIQKDLLQSTSMLLDVICHSTIKINTAMSAQISSIAAISKSTKDIERILKNEEVISQREKFTSSRLIDAKSATIIRIKSFNLELEPSKNNKPNIQPLDFHLYDRIGVLPRTNAQADNPYQVKKMSLKSVDENERESVFKRSTSQDFSNIVGSQSSLKAKSNSKTKLNDSVGSMSSLLKKAIRPMSQAPIRKEVVLEKVALTSRSRSSSIARNESFKRGEMSSLPPPPPPLPSISNFQSSASKSSIKNLDSSNKEIYNLDISTNRKHSFLDEIRNSKVSSLKPVRDSILEEMKFQDNTRVEKYVMRETSTTESFINQMKESSEFLDQLKEKQSIRKLSLSNSIQFDAEKKRRSSVNEAPDFMSEWKLKKSQCIFVLMFSYT